jgi:hypothetical protein
MRRGPLIEYLKNHGYATDVLENSAFPLVSAAQLVHCGAIPPHVALSIPKSVFAAQLRQSVAIWRRISDLVVDQVVVNADDVDVLMPAGPRQVPMNSTMQLAPSPRMPVVSTRLRAEHYLAPNPQRPQATPVRLVIDSRERGASDYAAVLSRETRRDTLPVGDFAFELSDTGEMLPILVERKTLSDLAASVLDNRYRLQKANMGRLTQDRRNSRLIYLVEEERNPPVGIQRTRVTTATSSTSLRDGFCVIHAKLSTQVEHWLRGLIAAAETSTLPRGPFIGLWKTETEDVLNRRMASTMLPRMLRTCKGCSHDLAVAVSTRFGTLTELYDFIHAQIGDDAVQGDFALSRHLNKGGAVAEKVSFTVSRILTSATYHG